MKVSILIPVFNAAPHLKQCIESAIAQTYKEKEIILIDDGSTDNSLKIANTFDKEIKIISRNNVGQAITRNQLLELSTGDWIQYLDADDYIYPDRLDQCLINLDKSIDVIISCSNSINKNDYINVINPITNLLEFYASYRRIPTINYLFKREVIKNIKWQNVTAVTTRFIYDLITTNKPKILLLPIATGVYRVDWSSNQQTKNTNKYTDLPDKFNQLLNDEFYRILQYWYYLISYSPYKYLTYNDAVILYKENNTISNNYLESFNIVRSRKYIISNSIINNRTKIGDNLYLK